MTKLQYAFVVLLFAIGVRLIILGTTHNAVVMGWGIFLHIWLVKAIGLTLILSSLGIFLVKYNVSLLPLHHGLKEHSQCTSHRATELTRRPFATRTGEKYVSREEYDASRPLVSLARTSREARLFLAVEKKRLNRHPTVTVDTNETIRAERTLRLV